MSLATTGVLRIPGAGVVLADIARRSRTFPGMTASLHLLQLYKKALVFWRERVGIDDAVRHQIGDGALLIADAKESPVNRHADLVDLLSSHSQRLDPFGHHCLSDNRTTSGCDAHLVGALDAFLLRKLNRHLDEELWLLLDVVRIVLRPIVEMLGEPVGRRNNRVLVRFSQLVPLCLERLGCGIGALAIG